MFTLYYGQLSTRSCACIRPLNPFACILKTKQTQKNIVQLTEKWLTTMDSLLFVFFRWKYVCAVIANAKWLTMSCCSDSKLFKDTHMETRIHQFETVNWNNLFRKNVLVHNSTLYTIFDSFQSICFSSIYDYFFIASITALLLFFFRRWFDFWCCCCYCRHSCAVAYS